MLLLFEHSENSEFIAQQMVFSFWNEQQSPFSHKFQMRSWTRIVLRAWDAQKDLVAFACVKLNH